MSQHYLDRESAAVSVSIPEPLEVDGTVTTVTTKSTTGTNSSVAGTTNSSTTLLAANSSRKGATIYNDNIPLTGATLNISLGATCTTTSFTIRMGQESYYEVPFDYTGIITCVFSAAAGNARVTEIT